MQGENPSMRDNPAQHQSCPEPPMRGGICDVKATEEEVCVCGGVMFVTAAHPPPSPPHRLCPSAPGLFTDTHT